MFSVNRSNIPAHLLKYFVPRRVYKPKDDAMIPAQVAIALRADGWYLRKDIIWAKRNCLPESITDRPTSSHEHIFLLAKSRKYYYDAEAIREPAQNWGIRDRVNGKYHNEGSGLQPHRGLDKDTNPAGRNKRDVWWIATQPFPASHFAVFPIELIRPCILAGSSERGCCPECGAPWERIIDKKSVNLSNAAKAETVIEGKGHVSSQVREGHDVRNGPTSINKTVGWRLTCACNAGDPVPCTILDPFFGSGTTGIIAKQEGRHYLGVELSEKYCKMARARIGREPTPLPF